MPKGSTPWQRIKLLVAGTKRSLLSAAYGNQIIRAVNCFIGIKAGRGIVIKRAEAGLSIEWNPNSPGEVFDAFDGGKPGAGVGSTDLQFKGEWVDSVTYYPGDIVYLANVADLAVGRGGLYISKTTNLTKPPPLAGIGDWDNDDWKVFAPFQLWHTWFIDPAADNGNTEINGGRLLVTLDNTESPCVVQIDKADLPESLEGLTIKLRQIVVCEDGVEKGVIALCSETFLI